MWVVNGLVALAIGPLSGPLHRKSSPVRVSGLMHDILEALSFNIAHDGVTVYTRRYVMHQRALSRAQSSYDDVQQSRHDNVR